jgi:SAM-dependent methyltransferase
LLLFFKKEILPYLFMTQRRNLVRLSGGESFKPPTFKPNSSAWNRFENWLRRFLDLQAGSIWRDVRHELASAQGRLLDIGCGAQVYRALLPPGVEYLGIDTEEAHERFGYDVPETHYFTGDDWGIGAGTFDVALCTEVLEHVPDPAALLARTHRVLKPGGRLVLTVPFSARWHFTPFDYWRFTPASLDTLLRGAGFDEVRVFARGNPLTVACYKAMALQLMLLFGAEARKPGPLRYGLGLLLLPVLGILACIANLSFAADWGDDCLGYTVTARSKEK